MKKILTLSLALVAVTGVFAQYPNRTETRDVILGGGGNRPDYNNGRYNTYSFSAKERDREIQRINRDFDARIRDIDRNRWMRSSEKSYQIRQLEQQRYQQVQAIRDRFNSRSNGHRDNAYARNDRRW